jgi:hypothetical protein
MLLSAVVVVVDVRFFQQPLIGAFLLLFFLLFDFLFVLHNDATMERRRRKI